MTDLNREESTADWVERSNGRRRDDKNKCAMHDYISNRNDHCFDIIKESIKTEVQKRDHKFEVLETKLENFISKWSMGIIVSITTALLGIIIGFGIWQIQTMREEMAIISKKVTDTTDLINNKVRDLEIQMLNLNVTQTTIIKQFERFAPEHELLMQHLRDVVTVPEHRHNSEQKK